MEVNRLVGEISDLQPAAAADSCSRVSCAPDLPPHQRAALPVSTHEVCHRGGDDPQGPLRRLQPACELYSEKKKKKNEKQKVIDGSCRQPCKCHLGTAICNAPLAVVDALFVLLTWRR